MPSTPTDRGVRLLKCLCQTEEEKAVAWHSDARSLERQRIPREFTTKSRVVIISNDWQTLNKNVAALQDRGHVLLFQPSASEVHAQAGKWFDDEEIYGWFASNLHRVREPSLRHYVRAKELKAAGMDWTEVLAEEESRTGERGLRLRSWECRLRQHGGARRGVCPARGRVPGDLLQLPPLSSEVDNAGNVAKLVMWSPADRCPGSSPFSIWNAT